MACRPDPDLGGTPTVVFDKTITVRAPPRRVFDALRPGLALAPGPPQRGARFLHVMDALGVRWETTTVLDRAEPAKALEFHQLAGDYADYRGRYELAESGDGGTAVRVRVEVDLPYVLPRLTTEEEIRRTWSRMLDGMLFALKSRLEGKAS